jgi:PEP-CTERM motif
LSSSFARDATLEIVVNSVFRGNLKWHEPLRFEPSISVALGRILRIYVERPLYNSDVGLTVDLFDWPMPLDPAIVIDLVEFPLGFVWDTSRLYTTGEVTLTAVPEPSTILLAVFGFVVALRQRVRFRKLGCFVAHHARARSRRQG